MRRINSILKRPLISEKSFGRAGENKYTFVVALSANKNEVAAACEKVFGVKVLCVNSANYQGKIKRTRKGSGRRQDFKKAIITLKKGDKIDLFETKEEENLKTKPPAGGQISK